jgi:two-component system, NarL family, nitrate/nitrite response regulator NarL
VKKSDQIVDPGGSEAVPRQECNEEAAHEGGSGGAWRRRRPARLETEQQPVWLVPVETVLVGPNVLLIEGLARILTAAGFRITAAKPELDDRALSMLPQERSILLIIDVSADFDAGLRQIKCFKQRYSAGRVVVLADQHHLTQMVSAFRAGANAYLAKIATAEIFVRLIELVALGVTLLPPEILNLISDRNVRSGARREANDVADNGHADRYHDDEREGFVGAEAETNAQGERGDSGDLSRLSSRQQAILRCLAEGCSNKAIAQKLAVAEATVKVHVKAILRKIRVHNRTQAAIWAMSHDLILAEDGSPRALQAPAEQPRELDAAHGQSEECKNGSTSSTEVKTSNGITVSSILRFIRKND